MAENLPKPGRQWVEVDVFDRYAHGGISILTTAPCCLPDQLPIGGLITGAPEAVTLDKGFYQVERMPVFVLPIGVDSSQDDGEQMARQMRRSDPGQDEKAGVVCHPCEVPRANGIGPADELVSGLGLPGCGAKEHAGEMASVAIADQIFEVLADGTLETQIMMGCQVVMAKMFFGGTGRRDDQRERGKFRQARSNGRRLFERHVRCRDRTGKATYPLFFGSDWRQGDESAGHEFDKEAACGEIFEFAGRSSPMPEFAEFTGKAIATP